MQIGTKYRAMFLLFLGIVCLNGAIPAARAEDNDARQKRFVKAEQKLTDAKSASPFRTGCVNYSYGCGYGSIPGYGYAPSYGERSSRQK